MMFLPGLVAHDPKQRNAQIENGERVLRVNGRRWRPCENTRSTEVEVAEPASDHCNETRT
jgi:hypothetical protein